MSTLRAERTILHALAEVSIRLYQRYLSPRKGYRCAYALRHDEPSCSAYGLRLIRTLPVSAAWRALRERFQACAMAAASADTPDADGSTRAKRRRKRRPASDNTSKCKPDWVDWTDVACCIALDFGDPC